MIGEKSSPRNQTIIDLANLRDNLLSLMQPEVLKNLADLLEVLGDNQSSFVHQFRTWVSINGPDCRYANMARQFFIQNQAEEVVKQICKLYNNWAKFYQEKG